MSIDVNDLRKLCTVGAIRWTGHVLKRLMQRGISQADVIQAIQTGEIIEQYPTDYPYPSCLTFGFSVDGRVLHVVCGLGEDQIWMITAYYPNPDEWETDLKTRKKVYR